MIASRNDRLVNEVYSSLKATGLPLPGFSSSTFDVQGYSAGVYRLSCTVSLSGSEPNQYDLVLVGPNGLAPPARSAPNHCRWLFRFDPGDVINPPR